MPEQVDILAIEVEDIQTIAERMTPEVEKAVPTAVKKVLDLLNN